MNTTELIIQYLDTGNLNKKVWADLNIFMGHETGKAKRALKFKRETFSYHVYRLIQRTVITEINETEIA
jgi:hypothetical protein